MEFLYEDKNILVCTKPCGINSEHTSQSDGMADMVAEYCGYAGVIHRLDRPVGGAMLFAKNPKAASGLSKLVSNGMLDKWYIAVVSGKPEKDEGVFKDLLFKDSSRNKTFVVKRLRKGVKEASLEYKVLETAEFEEKLYSLVLIKLHTGRTHQIRVQFSSRKMPLTGDGKYGGSDNRCAGIALWSHRLKFENPASKNEVDVYSYPPSEYPWNLFSELKFEECNK